MQAKDLPTKFWVEAVYCAYYLLNQIPMKIVGQVTSIEKWSSKKPYVGHLRMFGCVSWVDISDEYKKKLDPKSYACIMMGYSEGSKAYRSFDLVKQNIIT